jgi:hypothetical protein
MHSNSLSTSPFDREHMATILGPQPGERHADLLIPVLPPERRVRLIILRHRRTQADTRPLNPAAKASTSATRYLTSISCTRHVSVAVV